MTMALSEFVRLSDNDRAIVATMFGMRYQRRDDGTWRLRMLTTSERSMLPPVPTA